MNQSHNYNYANFAVTPPASVNQQEAYDSQLQLQQVPAYTEASPAEKRIENMLLSHSRYYVYCE